MKKSYQPHLIEDPSDTNDTSDCNSPNHKSEPPMPSFESAESNQPERWRKQDPTFLQTYFTCGWKHRIFANSSGNGQRFVALTQAVITSQIFGVLLLIMLSSVSVSATNLLPIQNF